MEQLYKDATYRAEAVHSSCEMFGSNSPQCASMIEMYENQHAMNVAVAKYDRFASHVVSTVILFFVVMYIGSYFYCRYKSR